MTEFDQLHVVSDLHLGGWKDRQAFDQGSALARVVDHLTGLDGALRVGLVLNGDVVDFLADRAAPYLDWSGAVPRLEAIFRDAAFAPVFAALAGFVRADKKRTLVIALGNHDVELALPDVQARLLRELAGDDPAARGRIVLAMDGAGYRCTVGGARVLCVHGNEHDKWNVVDYEALRRGVRALNYGAVAEAWTPNAGTRLVVDVMNGIKDRYPFVDLLKPEDSAVPRVLLALPTDYRTSLGGFAKSLARSTLDAAKLDFGWLASGGDDPDGKGALAALIAADARRRAVLTPPAEDPLDVAARHLALGVRPAALADGEGTLGVGRILADRLAGHDTREDLRRALQSLGRSDDTFDLGGKDDVFDALDAAVGEDVEIIVAGHTHLERKLARRYARGVYYNSGTWTRVLRLLPAMLADRDAFAPYYDAITAGSMEALDDAPALVIRTGTLVAIEATATGARAELRHAAIAPGQAIPEAPWQVVAETQYP